MQVLWTSDAIDDLEAIVRRRSEFSEESGRKLREWLVRRVDQLERFPESGRIVPEFGLALVRELIADDYRILYELFVDRVEVFAVRHGAQQITPTRPDS